VTKNKLGQRNHHLSYQ